MTITVYASLPMLKLQPINIANLFAGHTDHRAFSEKAGFNTHADDNRVARVENVLGVDAQFAREDGKMFELFTFLQQPLFAELCEAVEQMVDNVGNKYVDTKTVGHFLRLAFHFHVECHYHSISTNQQTTITLTSPLHENVQPCKSFNLHACLRVLESKIFVVSS